MLLQLWLPIPLPVAKNTKKNENFALFTQSEITSKTKTVGENCKGAAVGVRCNKILFITWYITSYKVKAKTLNHAFKQARFCAV